jgi:hypothetical protein
MGVEGDSVSSSVFVRKSLCSDLYPGVEGRVVQDIGVREGRDAFVLP